MGRNRSNTRVISVPETCNQAALVQHEGKREEGTEFDGLQGHFPTSHIIFKQNV